VARDAIARQYDVDKNSVTIDIEPGKGNYRPGTITFRAKEGKSIDLDRMRASLQATRLSGGTGMGVSYLELTVTGQVVAAGQELLLRPAGKGQTFTLAEDPEAKPKPDTKTPFRRLREAVEKGDKVTRVTGRVRGWSGTFPIVLRALAAESAKGTMPVLVVTEFQDAGTGPKHGR
jgi:hypothetical protein